MPKFRKKPVEVEAHQYLGKWVQGMCCDSACQYVLGNVEPHVHTIHGGQMVQVEVGDWILPEPKPGYAYPVKPDIFEATYERAEEPPPSSSDDMTMAITACIASTC